MDSSDIEVKFVFANYEKRTTLTTTKNTLGRELKQKLVESWPEDIPACDDLSRIRLICMGGILADEKALGPKFPVFDHPTPINVSIRPANAAPSQSQLSGKSSLLPSFIAGTAPAPPSAAAAASRPAAGGTQVTGTVAGAGTRVGNNNGNANPNANTNTNISINPSISSNNRSGAAGNAGGSDTAAAASGVQPQLSNNSMGTNSNNNRSNSRPPRSNQSTSGNSCCTVQ